MPLEAYKQDLESQRIELQGQVTNFIQNLINERTSVIPPSGNEDYDTVLMISNEITIRDDKLECFLEKYDEIEDILEKLNKDNTLSSDSRETLKSRLKIMAMLKDKVDDLVEEEMTLLSNSGGKRGKKTYKKRVRSRKTHKKRVMSRKFRMRRSSRLRSKVLV